MPDMAPVPSPLPVTPGIPVARLLAQAMQPGLAAELTATSGLVDPVSLSPAAQLQQAQDALGVTMQQLVSLLQEVEQITQLTSRAAPLATGEIAAEIGTTAGELGTGVQALLPPPDKTPLSLPQLAAGIALRGLMTLTLATRHAGEGRSDLASAAVAQASSAPVSRNFPEVSALQALPDGNDLPGNMPAKSSALDHVTPFTGPGTDGGLPADDAGSGQEALPADPGHEAQVAARAILRSAADTLGRMQLSLDAAAALAAAVHPAALTSTPSPGCDTAWCAAQIALAQAQVARASRAVESQSPAAPGWRRMAASLDQRSIGFAVAVGRHRRLVRIGLLLVPLCIATTALWMLSLLDLTLARIAAATLLALACLTWIWRRRASWRWPWLRIELRLRTGHSRQQARG